MAARSARSTAPSCCSASRSFSTCAFGTVAPAASNRSFRIAHPYYHHGAAPEPDVADHLGPSVTTRCRPTRSASATRRPERSTRSRRVRRVVLLGDSMIEGLGLDFPDTAAGILAARGRSRGIEVLNAAAVSYSPRLYDLKTRWLVEHEKLSFHDWSCSSTSPTSRTRCSTNPSFRTGSAAGARRAPSWWRRHSLLLAAPPSLRSHTRASTTASGATPTSTSG